MLKCSPSMLMCKSEQLPGLVMRSPFATMTRKPMRPYKVIPTRAATSVSTKLWVEPESSRAIRMTLLMTTGNCIMRPDRGWMPMRACREMVGSSAACCSASSSSATTSKTYRCGQTSLCPWVNSSGQWKQRPSLRRCAISPA
jgi:hypothetical protein